MCPRFSKGRGQNGPCHSRKCGQKVYAIRGSAGRMVFAFRKVAGKPVPFFYKKVGRADSFCQNNICGAGPLFPGKWTQDRFLLSKRRMKSGLFPFGKMDPGRTSSIEKTYEADSSHRENGFEADRLCRKTHMKRPLSIAQKHTELSLFDVKTPAGRTVPADR